MAVARGLVRSFCFGAGFDLNHDCYASATSDATMVRMRKRDRRLVNLRFFCDLAVQAARLQRSRVLGEGGTRHDLDFYLLSVWRLSELAHQAGKLGVQEAARVNESMHERWPLLSEVRNWWVHGKQIEWTTWFDTSIDRLQPDGNVRPVLDVEDDHDEVERLYEQLCEALGPLPELDE